MNFISFFLLSFVNYLFKFICVLTVFPSASIVKYLPALQEMQIRSPGWEDPLEKGIATHSSILA